MWANTNSAASNMLPVASHPDYVQSPAAPATAPTRTEFDALTSLRGVAASGVILVHLLPIWGSVFPALNNWTLFRTIAIHSYLFVDFFFLLSGFVMTHAYGKFFEGEVRAGDYKKFMLARFARVYPLHIVVLLTYVALAALGMKQSQENPEWSITANLFLVHAMGFFDRPTWNWPSWSISVEWWTYMIFPFALAFAHRHSAKSRPAILLVAGVLLFAAFVQYFGSSDLLVGFAFLRCLIGFFTGACLYRVIMSSRSLPYAGVIGNAALATVLFAFAFIASPLADMICFVAFCILIYAASKNTNEKNWLNYPALVWVGNISYSIYLWHSLVLHVFAKAIGVFSASNTMPQQYPVAFFILALLAFGVGILAVSHVSYKLIELPSRNMLRGAKK